MKRFFEKELQAMRSHLVEMGMRSVDQVRRAVTALNEGDMQLAKDVRAGDTTIDDLEVRIDAEAMKYMSLRAPVAGDLRAVVMAMKVASEFERIGDEAVNIAKRANKLGQALPPGEWLEEFQRMSRIVDDMLKDALSVFLEGDEDQALEICRIDNDVDRLDKKISKMLSAEMQEDPQFVQEAIHLLFVSRSFERIGDHCTNIAEEVVYLLRGEDIRHVDIKE